MSGGGLRACAGAELRALIAAQGRSQADVARAVGCSQKHLSNVLNDRAGSPQMLDTLARELGYEFVVRLRRVVP